MRKFVLMAIAAVAVVGVTVAQAATPSTKREMTLGISPTHNVGKTIGADLRLLTYDDSAAQRPVCRNTVFGGPKTTTDPITKAKTLNYPQTAVACVVPDAGKHDDITLAKGMALNNAVFAPNKQVGSGTAYALGYNCTQNNLTPVSNPVGGQAEKLTIKIYTAKTSKGKTDSKTLRTTLTGTTPLAINASLTIRITRSKNRPVKLSFDLPHNLLMPIDFNAASPQGLGPPPNTGICAALVDAKLHLDKTSVRVNGTRIGLLTTSSTSCPTKGSFKGKFSVSNKVDVTDGAVKTATDPNSGFKTTRTLNASATARCKV